MKQLSGYNKNRKMTYNYYFEDDINKKTVNELADIIQDKESVRLYFSTEGGETDAMRYLISVFNSHPDLTLILNCYLYSAGCLILTEYKGKLEILETVESFMFHKFDRLSYTLREQIINTNKLLSLSEEENEIFAKKLKKKDILTDKQIKKFKKGKDVVLYRDEILKLKL